MRLAMFAGISSPFALAMLARERFDKFPVFRIFEVIDELADRFMADVVTGKLFRQLIRDDLWRPLFFEQHLDDIMAKRLVR